MAQSRSSTLKMSNLPEDTTEQELDRFIRERHAGEGIICSRLFNEGYALINFANYSLARTACSRLDCTKMRSRTIHAKLKGEASPSQKQQYTVKINHFPTSVSEEELRCICLPHGNLLNIKINLGFAYINFSSLESAENAIAHLNCIKLAGIKVKAKMQGEAYQPQVRPNEGQHIKQEVYDWQTPPNSQYSLHASIPYQHHLYSQSMVQSSSKAQASFGPSMPSQTNSSVKVEIDSDGLTSDELLGYFTKFGKLEDKPIIRSGSPNYAYVNYTNADDAFKACKDKVVTLKQVKLKIKPSSKGKQCIPEIETKTFKSEDTVINQLLVNQSFHEINKKLMPFDVNVTPLDLTSGGLQLTGSLADVLKAEVVMNSEVSILQSRIIKKSQNFHCSAIPHFFDPHLFQSVEQKHSAEFLMIKNNHSEEKMVVFSAIVASSLQNHPVKAALFDDYFSPSIEADTGISAWFFQEDSGVYTKMKDESSLAIEQLYQRYKANNRAKCSHTIGQWTYMYDFVMMQQVNNHSHKIRSIQRNLKQDDRGTSKNLTVQCRGIEAEVTAALQELQKVITDNSSTVELRVEQTHREEVLKLANQFCVVAIEKRPGRISLEGLGGYVDQVKLELKAKILDATQPIMLPSTEVKGPYWEPQTEETELKHVDRSTDEWEQIQQEMRISIPHASIVKVQRIQNKWLWEKFAFCRQRMSKKNGSAGVNEKRLFHGPGQTPPQSIYRSEHGFDFRFGNTGKWGKGAYFASEASYSNNYAHSKDHARRQIFIAFVLTGLSTTLLPKSSLDKPPLKPGSKEDRYDSVNGQYSSTKIFIVYDHDKSYPAYLVTYK